MHGGVYLDGDMLLSHDLDVIVADLLDGKARRAGGGGGRQRRPWLPVCVAVFQSDLRAEIAGKISVPGFPFSSGALTHRESGPGLGSKSPGTLDPAREGGGSQRNHGAWPF